jgi:hypothetical protein
VLFVHFNKICFKAGLLACLIAFGCKRDTDVIQNLLPETHISIGEINLSGEDRLNSLITLNWWGTDKDGFVKGYEISFDQNDWFFTERQDSTFQFVITAGSDTVDMDLWVRAIDNENQPDETPAYLSIPLKNTPPEVHFDEELNQPDTAYLALTLVWKGSDLDGNSTMKNFELRINDGDWTALKPFKSTEELLEVVTIIPNDIKASGAELSTVFYEDFSAGPSIDGLKINALNNVYVRATDIANSVSIEDTLSDIYFKGQRNDVLILGAHSAQANEFYKSNLNMLNIKYDFIDFASDNGKNQPKIWSPTLSHMLSPFSKVILYTDEATFTNAQTQATDVLLEFAAPAIQRYIDEGGKMLISTALPDAYSTQSALFGVLPVDSLSTAPGQARLPIDSLAVGQGNYPDLLTNTFIIGLDPIYPSADAEVIYKANMTKTEDWFGPDNIGVKRISDNKTTMVFFSVELHKLDGDPDSMNSLFDLIMSDEF